VNRFFPDADLKAVVFSGIVAAGDHDAAVHRQGEQ
jgi:hypothetical protein